ncbi:dehydrodolichyl diphosphate synthase complex subunit DHDDS-like [Macrosteles quadrilineatus]|uniref:dehydrodolichyl diphosphate synthase complex subunit DHDDS-like n=1 Tax=Macrosteles quadrilineatus TaxID=74068 RepID=UPI0023E2E6BC|nr:dehydrodolichyl diphosphate synthase complex subunit DHDDS-like [Macrosteles quadrilineatus]
MSWIRDSSLTWAQLFCVRVLKCGVIPKHVAFIMDGNRRYAKQTNVKKLDGHSKGFDKLAETLQWCLDLGVSEVTVYAFSIENFKRSKDEVDDLLRLATQKFQRLLDEKDKLMENGVRIRVIGNISLLPPDLTKLIAEVELLTKYNNKAILNVAFAYTARDEMAEAMKQMVEGHRSSDLDLSDINVQLLSKSLYTMDSPYPDLCIRTSGEKRLSDFLLLQTAYSYLYFTDVLWPNFTAWHLLAAVFHFQRAYPTLLKVRSSLPKPPLSDKAAKFLENVEEKHWKKAAIAASS